MVSKLQYASTLDKLPGNQDDESRQIYLMTTPALLASSCNLLYNLVFLNPGLVVNQVLESGLFESLMR